MIERREFIRGMAAAGIGTMLPGRALHGPLVQFLNEEGFETIRRGVGLYVNRGGTIGWLILDDALVVVDSQFSDTAERCLSGIQDRSSKAIDYLINTHHHGDHTNGNPIFREHVGHIVAHENVPVWQWNRARERELEDPVVADIVFRTQMELDLGSEQIVLSYSGPAHTSGDAVIHFVNANVVHMGDLVFNRWPCFIDRDSGASIRGWIQVLEETHDRMDDETLFIFGHGSTVQGKRADLLVQRDFLGALLEFAERSVSEGLSLDEIRETQRLPGFPDHYNPEWENGIPNALEKAYLEVTQGPPILQDESDD